MRTLIAWAFMYSLDGLLPDQDSEYWRFCFGLPVDAAEQRQNSTSSRARTRTLWDASRTRPWLQP